MSDEMKKNLAHSIRQQLKELNDLIQAAENYGLSVSIHSDILRRTASGSTSAAPIRITVYERREY